MFNCHEWPRRYAYARGLSDRSINRAYYETRRTGSGGFGVRRPLRYLSYHLDLDEHQRRKVAASFERIKLEREQAKLDSKKVDGVLADAFLSSDVSVDALQQALAPRTQVESNMQIVLAKELVEISMVLDSDQREEFAHLIRTGVLKL